MADLIITIIKIVLVFFGLQIAAAIMIWMERRVSGGMQDRWGPNRVGPFGLLQPLADIVKLTFKEELTPARADKVIYTLAPAITLVPAMVVFAVIPFGGSLNIAGREIKMYIADVNIGILYVLAVSSLGLYGIVFGSWASYNKYSLLGGERSAAQMLNYELFMGSSLVGIVILTGSLRLTDIVLAQTQPLFWKIPSWNIIRQPIGFAVFVVASFAESNRMPFDLPESEQELVGGYNTEYNGVKFAMYFLAEYASVFTSSALMVTLFFGGWTIPGIDPYHPSLAIGILHIVSFIVKVTFFILLFMVVRWTLSRMRYDQSMRLGWKFLLPLALANIVITGLVTTAIHG
ncbi:MAG: NADH-quinone oxidoreductase subunit NuoH [bacterium]